MAGKNILLSAVGTTDPVRGMRDGALMHIMRKYYPEEVYILFTPELWHQEQERHHIEKMMQFICENWNGYQPVYHTLVCDVQDASDLDEVEPHITKALVQIRQEHPKKTILVNLSSGTPQMKTVLSMLTMDIRYKTVGIQVKNPEKKAGTTMRTNGRGYDVEAELELNEDEQPDAPDRTVQPKFLSLQRTKKQEQVRALLKRRDYDAICAIPDSLEETLMHIVEHLAARDQLQDAKARKIARTLKLPFELYPIAPGTPQDAAYESVVEYYLSMRNMQQTGRLGDLLLRMNPFVIEVQVQLLKTYLPFPLEAILDSDEAKGRRKLSADHLRKKAPQMCAYIEKKTGKPFANTDLSIYVNNLILEQLPGVPNDFITILRRCQSLNQRRNAVAHRLCNATEDDVKALSSCTSRELMDRLRNLLRAYPQYTDERFLVQHRCQEYILENM